MQIDGADFKNDAKNPNRAMVYYLLVAKWYNSELFTKNNVTYAFWQIDGADFENDVKNSIRAMVYYLLVAKWYILVNYLRKIT